MVLNHLQIVYIVRLQPDIQGSQRALQVIGCEHAHPRRLPALWGAIPDVNFIKILTL